MQSIYLRGCEFRMNFSCFCCCSSQSSRRESVDGARHASTTDPQQTAVVRANPTLQTNSQLQPSAPPRDAICSTQAPLPPAFASWPATTSPYSLPNQVTSVEDGTSPVMPEASSDEEGPPQASEAGSTFPEHHEAPVIVAEAVPPSQTPTYDARATPEHDQVPVIVAEAVPPSQTPTYDARATEPGSSSQNSVVRFCVTLNNGSEMSHLDCEGNIETLELALRTLHFSNG